MTPEHAPRKLEDYLDGYFIAQLKEQQAIELPEAHFVLLASSGITEQSYETSPDGGDPLGLFSRSLIHTLRNASGNISYSDLFVRTKQEVLRSNDRQRPALHLIGDQLDRIFLSNRSQSEEEITYTVYHAEGQWKVEVGLLEELQRGETFREQALEIRSRGTVVGTAQPGKVDFDCCELELDFTANPEEFYETKLTFVPNLHLELPVSGDPKYQHPFEDWLGRLPNPGLTIDWERAEEDSLLNLKLEEEIFTLRWQQNHFLRFGSNESTVVYRKLWNSLKYIAKWNGIYSLENASPSVEAQEIKVRWEQLGENNTVTDLEDLQHDFETEQPFRLNLRMTLEGPKQEFYYAVLLLQSDLSIQTLFSGKYEQLLLQKTIEINFPTPGPFALKTLFSPHPINSQLLEMPGMEQGEHFEFEDGTYGNV